MECPVCESPVKVHRGRVAKYCSRACANTATGYARRRADMERFQEKVERRGECFIWTAATAGEGDYGYFWYQGKLERAHRASWMMARGDIPDGLFVLHSCDTPQCVRPEHLFLGTHEDNMTDRDTKGRVASGGRAGSKTQPEAFPRGSERSDAKMTEDLVFDFRVRHLGEMASLAQLAAEADVDVKTVHRAVRGETWTHVAIPREVYVTMDKQGWGDGPWVREADKIVFADEATGLPCLIKRNTFGSLCGYVGVSEDHPWFAKHYGDVPAEVHGGLTFADLCQEGDEARTICHVPGPGEPDRIWWLGFDCGHAWDIAPAMEARERGHGWEPIRMPDMSYKTVAYVKAECARLAEQAAAAAVV